MWCFTLTTILSYDLTVCLGQVMFEYNLYPFFPIIAGKAHTLFIAIITKWCFCWCCLMMRVLLTFLRRSPLYVGITISTDTDPATSCFAQLLQYSQNILKLLAFKYFLNEVLLKTECTKVMLISWFVWIECITSFSKFSFLISFFKWFPSNFNFIGKTVPFPSTDIMILKESYWNSSLEVSLWTLKDRSISKYLQKIFTNWFVYWSFMIDKRKPFDFWIREAQTN